MSFVYASELYNNDTNYILYYQGQPLYLYQVIAVNISTADTITFISNSTMDLVGSLYNNSFNPTNLSLNLVLSDDDSANDGQFLLQTPLDPHTNNILVVLTNDVNQSAPFNITAYSTNATVQFNKINMTRPITTTQTTCK